jgi:transposase
MRTGISFTVSTEDRHRLNAIVAAPTSLQKHGWRARIILLSDESAGISAIMTGTGRSKTCVWRWQERFMHEGVDGLLCDKSRPPGKARVLPEQVAEIARLTQEPPPFEATHWTLRAMAKVADIAASTVQTIWKAPGLSPHRCGSSSCRMTRPSLRNSRTSSACTSIRRPMPRCFRSTRSRRSRPSTALSPGFR